MTRRIGSTAYKVKVVFPGSSGETMEEKILRMIGNEGLQNAGKYGMMDAPQMRADKLMFVAQRKVAKALAV